MSSLPSSGGHGKKKPLRYAAIIASLGVLAIILSPVSPFAQQSNPSGGSAGTIDEAPQPEDTSDEDVLVCTSLIQGVEYVIVGGRLEPIGDEEFPEEGEGMPSPEFNLTTVEKLAADTLLGEFCNRPELVQNMSLTYDPTVNLVAYGCEVASGKMGDAAMQDSIVDYAEIYCSSAIETIEFEALSWSDSAEIFKTEVIPLAREQLESEGNSTVLLDEADIVLANVTESLNSALELLESGSVYDSANALDRAITGFTAFIERDEVVSLLNL